MFFVLLALVCLLLPAHAHGSLDMRLGPNQEFELNNDLPDNRWEFSFIQITDLHIGEGYDDYGTTGYDDSPPAGDEGHAAQMLREAVNWVNSNKYTHRIQFALITGDITDSAEKSEYLKAKEILDSLRVPYLPTMGNHDTWPYYKNTSGEWVNNYYPIGDQYFREVFGGHIDAIRDSGFFAGWDDGTRNTAIWNGEADTVGGADEGCNSYFANYSFDYAGYHFIVADFNTRNRALAGSPGAMGYADLYDSGLCQGTWPWYRNHFESYPYRSANNMLTFCHQPLYHGTDMGAFVFSEAEYNTVTDYIDDNNFHENTGMWMGGHYHQYTPGFSPPFEYEIKTSGGDFICPGIHSPAVKDDEDHFRVVKIWGKTSTPAPDGVVLFENDNYGGRSELFVGEDADLSNNFIGDDSASSLRIMGTGTAEIFEGASYQGGKLELTGDVPQLSALGFDNKASSVRFNMPVIEGITPDRANSGIKVEITDLAGERFNEGAITKLVKSGSNAIYGQHVKVVSAQKITCTFDLEGAAPGKWNVVVSNPEGQQGILEKGFQVQVPEATWYLAEGSTGSDASCSFETWVLVQNPGTETATVDITYMTESGEVPGPQLELEPGSRGTVNVADTVPGEWSVATRVTGDKYIIAERSTYWNGRQGGHDSIGVTTPNKTWYLAEGSTGSDASCSFETWVLVQNPGTETATVDITYMTESGEVPGPQLELEPGSRGTVNVADTVPGEWSVATRVTGDKDIIAERSTYWNGRQGGHDSIGMGL
ncbi:MAG: metallophosphoesterase [Actinobacteria bacterium]|nr:metallophosphoesterase [Actinomycetota bacterium]MBU4357745.1 metallophosphoesterase [Actinomycetota bacterium]MBU4442043.1 metallophosphoesterase [Actinomycetota bacterium]